MTGLLADSSFKAMPPWGSAELKQQATSETISD